MKIGEWNYSREFPCDGPRCSSVVETKKTQWCCKGTPKDKRKRHYCCNACRQAAYRKRHRKPDPWTVTTAAGGIRNGSRAVVDSLKT